MKRSDIGVTALMYAFTLFFLYMTLELPPDAQTYPLCLIAGLLILNTCYLVRCLWQLRRQAGIHNDLPDLFAGFQWKQFAFICLGCVGYMLLMHVAGFYIASICYLVACPALAYRADGSGHGRAHLRGVHAFPQGPAACGPAVQVRGSS